MRYLILSTIGLLIFLSACQKRLTFSTNSGFLQESKAVAADIETEPVHSKDDAADDPVIWVNSSSPEKSLIIGTNKKSGIAVYDLSGKQLSFVEAGRINNIDLRYDFKLGDEYIDMIACTNRTTQNIDLYTINKTTLQLVKLNSQVIHPDVQEDIYGCCLYKSDLSGITYVNVVSKAGEFEQWELFDDGNKKIGAKLVRVFDVGGISEGMVADDLLGNLFIAQEDAAVWKYSAEPESGNQRQMVCDFTNKNLKADLEGLTLYIKPKGKGYLLVSSQGNNSYAIFNRNGNNEYIASFRIEDGLVDGTSETDGIDVCSNFLGDNFPEGILVVQDGKNKDGKVNRNQNFKVIDWRRIKKITKPEL